MSHPISLRPFLCTKGVFCRPRGPIQTAKRFYLDGFGADYFNNASTPNHYKGALRPQQKELSQKYSHVMKQADVASSKNAAIKTPVAPTSSNIDPCFYMGLYNDMPQAVTRSAASAAAGTRVHSGSQNARSKISHTTSAATFQSTKSTRSAVEEITPIHEGYYIVSNPTPIGAQTQGYYAEETTEIVPFALMSLLGAITLVDNHKTAANQDL